jgi:hypothetical protein
MFTHELSYRIWTDGCPGCATPCFMPYFKNTAHGAFSGELRHGNTAGLCGNAMLGYDEVEEINALMEEFGFDAEDVQGLIAYAMDLYEHGIMTFRYTEPMTWWMTMPTSMPRTMEAALAEFESAIRALPALAGKSAAGRRVGLISNAGFECVILADSLKNGFELELSTIAEKTSTETRFRGVVRIASATGSSLLFFMKPNILESDNWYSRVSSVWLILLRYRNSTKR